MLIKQVNRTIARLVKGIHVSLKRDPDVSLNEPCDTFFTALIADGDNSYAFMSPFEESNECIDFIRFHTGCSRVTAKEVDRLLKQLEE